MTWTKADTEALRLYASGTAIDSTRISRAADEIERLQARVRELEQSLALVTHERARGWGGTPDGARMVLADVIQREELAAALFDRRDWLKGHPDAWAVESAKECHRLGVFVRDGDFPPRGNGAAKGVGE